MSCFYSTQPYLARCLNRYFYNGKHYVWASTEFYPYRLPNPRSSNPYLIYQDLYEPWKDDDIYSKMISQFRLNLIAGVKAREKQSVISSTTARRLRRVCKKVDVKFLYPLVYRIQATPSIQKRASSAGSAAVGSSEYLIEDLDETNGEFEELFLDFTGDADFEQLLSLPIGDAATALPILESRC